MKLPKQIGDLEFRRKQTNSLLNCCIYKHDQESWCEVVKTVSPDKTEAWWILLYICKHWQQHLTQNKYLTGDPHTIKNTNVSTIYIIKNWCRISPGTQPLGGQNVKA